MIETVVAAFPNEEALKFLEGIASEVGIGVAKMTIKEVMKRLENGEAKSLKKWLSLRNITNREEDMIVVNLSLNPSLYGVLGREEFYQKFVLLEEEKGTVLLKKDAEPFLNNITSTDPELFEFERLKQTLENMVSGNEGVSNILTKSIQKAQENNRNAKLATDLGSDHTTINDESTDIGRLLNDVIYGKVKANEFQSRVKEIIKRSIELTISVSDVCVTILNEFGAGIFSTHKYKDGSQTASYLLTVCNNASNVLDRLAFKWNQTTNRSQLNDSVGKFTASLIQATVKEAKGSQNSTS